jgi:hypothetical protein
VPSLWDPHPLGADGRGDPEDDVLVSALPGAEGRAMTAVPQVTCTPDSSGGWRCTVIVRDLDNEVSRHDVTVRQADLDRLAPGDPDPVRLVSTSFEFLLEREPPSSILSTFDLMVIARYFPEFETEIRRSR